eukprot:3242428-Alexandrium_andersonii.AAC.1
MARSATRPGASRTSASGSGRQASTYVRSSFGRLAPGRGRGKTAGQTQQLVEMSAMLNGPAHQVAGRPLAAFPA